MLQAKNLRKTFDNLVALNKLNLHISEGEIYCLLGANGAGKSTTINLFLNFLTPDSGTAMINGIDVNLHPVLSKKHLSYIPENVMLYGSLTGAENLNYFVKLSNNRKISQKELCEILSRCGLQKDAHHKPISTYSKGMRQKVVIALAIVRATKVMLLDEPTSGLDPKASNEFSTLLKNLSNSGTAVLMATHDLFYAKETSDRIGIMKAGELVKELISEKVSHADLERIYLDHMK